MTIVLNDTDLSQMSLMPIALAAIEEAFAARSAGKWISPPRTTLFCSVGLAGTEVLVASKVLAIYAEKRAPADARASEGKPN